jgi:hypothetical protein
MTNTAILGREQQLQVNAIARTYQERYDHAFEPWGARARSPVMGEDIREYRRDLAVQAKKLLPEDNQYRKNQYRRLDDSVMDVLEPQLLQVVHKAAYDPTTVPYDAPLREVKERDASGREHIKFIGQRSFIHDFTRPGRRVVSFAQPADNHGRALNEFGHSQPPARLVLYNGLAVGTTGRGEL